MMMQRLYYYPPRDRDGHYGNAYSEHYREALGRWFRVVNLRGVMAVAKSVAWLAGCFRAEVYVVNWLENIAYFRGGRAQFWLVRLGLWVIRRRGGRIVWMFHNIHPHGGHNACSRWLHGYLFRHAALIISHSREAADYARTKTEVKVLYVCHPVHAIALDERKVRALDERMDAGSVDGPSGAAEACDVLIWGSIIPYKGVEEFVRVVVERRSDLKVRILGRCEDRGLAARIAGLCEKCASFERDKGHCGGGVVFDNRRASFEEIAWWVRRSRYVLFPYVGSCVSSSGALIDTVVMGGTSVGPSVGAFRDLAE